MRCDLSGYTASARSVCLLCSSLVVVGGFFVLINLPYSVFMILPLFVCLLLAVDSGEAWRRWAREDAEWRDR